MTNYESAIKIAVKIIKQFEGCNLVAYPDPASPLYKALSTHNMLRKYMSGTLKHKDLPDNFKALDGKPWTAMYGETLGVRPGDVFTQEQADRQIAARVKSFMDEAISASPKLASLSPEKIAAVTSLIYNIGGPNYKTSTVARKIEAGDIQGAAAAFAPWKLVKGVVNQGLINRRKMEAALFMSV